MLFFRTSKACPLSFICFVHGASSCREWPLSISFADARILTGSGSSCSEAAWAHWFTSPLRCCRTLACSGNPLRFFPGASAYANWKPPFWTIPQRSEEHTSELQSHHDLHSFPTRRSSDLGSGHCPFHSPTPGYLLALDHRVRRRPGRTGLHRR